jgi:hypothetical protein
VAPSVFVANTTYTPSGVGQQPGYLEGMDYEPLAGAIVAIEGQPSFYYPVPGTPPAIGGVGVSTAGQFLAQFGNEYTIGVELAVPGTTVSGLVINERAVPEPQGYSAFPCVGGAVVSYDGGLSVVNTLSSGTTMPVTTSLLTSGVSPVSMAHDGRTVFWSDTSGAIGHLAVH